MTIGIAPATGQTMANAPNSYGAAPMVLVTPQPRAERSALGGGFIEFLFGEREPEPTLMPAPSNPYPPARSLYVNIDPSSQPDGEQESLRAGMNPIYLRQLVDYDGQESSGTIIIDTPNRFLYLVESNGKAIRYGIGVGRPGFTWAGVHAISSKREWPDWYPPDEMLKRQPDLPRFMPGGPNNPLGARALYLGSTLYRIHGSNEPWTIGHRVSSGCIRLRNEDVIDLYERVKVGTKVVVI